MKQTWIMVVAVINIEAYLVLAFLDKLRSSDKDV